MKTKEQGAALIASLVATGVMLILLSALMSTRVSELKAITATIEASRAQLLAEAGVDYIIATLIRDNGSLPTGLPKDYGNLSWAGGHFHPILSLDGSNNLIVTSVGTDASGIKRAVEAVLELKLSNPLRDFAVLSCGNVTIGGSSQVVGGDVYAAGNLSISASSGIQGAKGIAKSTIDFSSSGSIDGSVISKTGSITASGAALRVTGYASNPLGNASLIAPSQAASVNHDPSIWNVPDYCDSPWIDPYVVTDSDFNDYRSAAMTASSYFGDVSVSTGSLGAYGGQRYISGNMTIGGTPAGFAFSGIYYVTGNLTITGRYKGNATFIVDGNVIFNGTSASTASDEESHAYVTKGNVEVFGNATIDGLVYTRGNATGSGNATINGGIITLGNGEFGGNYQINYKKHDVAFPNSQLNTFDIVRWRRVSP